jgi:hypothetical protein
MEHPLIHSLNDESLEDLSKKISELHRKLTIAHRIGNGYLCDQIRMAIESYTTKHQEKMAELYRPKNSNDVDFDSKIDIS